MQRGGVSLLRAAASAFSPSLATRSRPHPAALSAIPTSCSLSPRLPLFLLRCRLASWRVIMPADSPPGAPPPRSAADAVDLPTAATPAWLAHRADLAVPASGPGSDDWVRAEALPALTAAASFRPAGAVATHPPRVLVLYGTLRPAGFSKLLAAEAARLAEGLGCDVRTFDPHGLPVRDPALADHPKVTELRALVHWSEAHVWVGAELHGALCSVLKNQIDTIPLNTGSVRPTQGKAVAVMQVCGGSQSFNTVNALRLLARWMRMACVVNQSSIPMAWTQFDADGRLKAGSLRERVVDVVEEFVRLVRINREYADELTDRYSERREREAKGRLLTQAEKVAEKEAADRKDKANE